MVSLLIIHDSCRLFTTEKTDCNVAKYAKSSVVDPVPYRTDLAFLDPDPYWESWSEYESRSKELTKINK
jgi:hypothetical protein